MAGPLAGAATQGVKLFQQAATALKNNPMAREAATSISTGLVQKMVDRYSPQSASAAAGNFAAKNGHTSPEAQTAMSHNMTSAAKEHTHHAGLSNAEATQQLQEQSGTKAESMLKAQKAYDSEMALADAAAEARDKTKNFYTMKNKGRQDASELLK